MLTIAKVINTKGGYEVKYGFCIVRDAEKYEKGELYVCKIVNRFTDSNGDAHLVVVPMHNEPVSKINYDLAEKIEHHTSDGISYLRKEGYSEDDVSDFYEDTVQNFWDSLIS